MDPLESMPSELKPAGLAERDSKRGLLSELKGEILKKRPVKNIVGWVILVLVLIFIAVQYINAEKYDALVQAIDSETFGVNPTGERLDFGDLPKDKSAVRTVSLINNSPYKVSSYIMVWKFGEIGDLIRVDKNYFTLKPGAGEKLEFTTRIPNSAELKYYKGKVIIFQIPKPW